MVLCSGCFDGLHAGHIAYLTAAKALTTPNEQLLVAIAPDYYLYQAKHRGARWSQADRAATVSALSMVDGVLVHSQLTPASLIRIHWPRLFVKGVDWRDRLPGDIVDALHQVGCKAMFTDTDRHEARTR